MELRLNAGTEDNHSGSTLNKAGVSMLLSLHKYRVRREKGEVLHYREHYRKERGTLQSREHGRFYHHLQSQVRNQEPSTSARTKDRRTWNVATLTRNEVMVALLTPPRMKACCHDRPAAKHPSSGKTGFQRKEWPRWRSVHHTRMKSGFDLAPLDQALADTSDS